MNKQFSNLGLDGTDGSFWALISDQDGKAGPAIGALLESKLEPVAQQNLLDQGQA